MVGKGKITQHNFWLGENGQNDVHNTTTRATPSDSDFFS